MDYSVVELLVGEDDTSIYSKLTAHLAGSNASLCPQPAVDFIFTSLVQLLHRGPHSAAVQIIKQPQLLARAKFIAVAANRAEHLLEEHYASLIANSASNKPPSTPSPDKLDCDSRVMRLAKAATPFPYIGNYVRLVHSECAVFSAILNNDLRSVAVVGSGPMPLTGALMGAVLGAHVTLVDKDEDATRMAAELIALWEQNGSLQPGLVRAIQADATEVRFSRSVTMGHVAADIVLVASLIPDDAKVTLVRHLAEDGWDGIVGVRSAHGLTAVTNYEKANREELSDIMDFVGYAVPQICVENGSVIDDNEKPMAIFPQDVLNSLEIYTKRYDDRRVSRKMKENVEKCCGQGVLDGGTVGSCFH